MINLEVQKDVTYVLAANYGPDSMALTHALKKAEANFVMAYVNYKLDPSWDAAEEGLKKYCEQYGIAIEILNAREGRPENEEEFEKWAHKVRYDFFEEIYKKYDAAALFIPHQQDDVIEAHLVAKETGVKTSKYGLNAVTTARDMIVRRPLINYSREDLVEYCRRHIVPFDENFSNYQQDKSKSKIRREVVSKLDVVERERIIEEMKRRKSDVIDFATRLKKHTEKGESLNVREIIALDPGEFAETLIKFVKAKTGKATKLTPKIIADCRAMCLDPKPNMTLKIRGNVYFTKEYDEISVDTDGLEMPYQYELEKPCKFACENFELDFTMGAEDRNIHLEDYPITVRSILPQDVYLFGGYSVNAKAMLVAAGVSERLLHVWPVFLNKNGKIIYIPRYKKGFFEYHKSRLNIFVKEEEK